MMNKKEIKQFAKRVVRAQQGLKNHQLMHPRREWMIGVSVAVCIFAASTVWSSLKYFEYQNIEQQSTVQPEAPVVVYRETLVAEALGDYEAKADRLDVLLGDSLSNILANDIPEEVVENEVLSDQAATSSDESATTSETTIQDGGEQSEEESDTTETPQASAEESPIETETTI